MTTTPTTRRLAPSSTIALAGFTRDSVPGRIVYRDGALDDVRDELERIGAQRVMLIVADYDDHLAEQAQHAVADRLHVVWDEVRQHVPRELAARATAAATDNHVDALVTVGGGSTIGLGKAVAVS